MLKKLLFIPMPVLLLANPFQTTLQDEIQWLEEETYVVSASRVEENIKKTPASISVFDEDKIKKSGAKNIFDILKMVPGIGISQSNIYIDKVSVRGVQTWFSEKVLFLLNGHSLNIDLLNGGATGTYKNIPLEIIKKIEVIKGPASAVYGENAFNALVNIITKDSKDINGSIVVLKKGSNNNNVVNLTYGKNYDNFELVLNHNHETSDGENKYVVQDASGNSGYTNPSLKSSNTFLSLKAKSGLYFTGNYNVTEDGPNFGVTHVLNNEDFSYKKTYLSELGYKKDITGNLNLSAKVYHDRFIVENTWKVGGLFQVDYKTEKTGIESLLTYKKDHYTFVSGVSFEEQIVKDASQTFNASAIPTFIDDKKRNLKAVYGELIYDINNKLRVNSGIRYDDYSDFGSTLNSRIGLTYEINKDNNLKLMYGEAFRAPTFAELYNKNNPTLVGNPSLDPEKVKTTELTLQNSSIENSEMSLTIFQSNIEDIVQIGSANTYINEGKITTKGLEFEIKYDLYRGSYIVANYTYQDPKDKTTNNDVSNVAKHLAYMGLNYRIDKNFNLYLDMNYTGKQTRDRSIQRDDVNNSIITNTTLSVKDLFYKNMELRFSIYNMFNEKTYDSADIFDYPVSQRSYLAQLIYKF